MAVLAATPPIFTKEDQPRRMLRLAEREFVTPIAEGSECPEEDYSARLNCGTALGNSLAGRE
jgi:hypothetical protein